MNVWTPLQTVYVALAVGSAGVAPANGNEAWTSDFTNGVPGKWEPYGETCTVKVVRDNERGRNVLVSEFDDASSSANANKGTRIKFAPGISWQAFNYLAFHYQVNRSVNAIACLLHDQNGNWWRADRGSAGDVNVWGTVKTQEWADLAFNKSSFVFQWNDNAKITHGEKDADIVELFVFVSTPETNKGVRYHLRLDGLAFCRVLPPGANVQAAMPAAGEAADLEAEASPFPLQWKVSSLNANGNLVVDGQPFFPLGLYSCFGIDQASATHQASLYTGDVTKATTMARLRVIKDAGFNLLQTYTMQFYGTKVSGPSWEQSRPGAILEKTTPDKLRNGMLQFMDHAQAAGLKVMIGADQPYCLTEPLPTDAKAREKEWARKKIELKAGIDAFEKHPALIVWYLIDEPSQVPPKGMPVADLTDCYRYIKSLDTVRPMMLPSCSYLPHANGSDKKYRHAVDIMAPDPYPIGSDMRIRTIADTLDLMKKDQVGNPPMPQLWAVIQICQWVEGPRLPSVEEMRLMSLLALTRDVKGLMFYEYKNYPDRQPQQWKKIGQVVNSLHTLIPDLLASSEIVKNYGVSSQKIDAILRKVNDPKRGPAHYSLIAVNATQNAALEPEAVGLVTFAFGDLPLPKGSTVTVLDEDKTGKLSLGSRRELKLVKSKTGYSFSDTFDAYASHVYRIGTSE
jgi:hypothetical protein